MKKGMISRNISLLMEHFNIRNESQLAKLVRMPQTTVNKLITGVSSDPRVSTLTPIIEHFKISLDTLLSDNPIFTPTSASQQDLLIPIATLDELGDIHTNLNSLKPDNWPQWYPIPKQSSLNYYAIQLTPKQLLPPFHDACIVIVKNESKLPQSGYCLLKHLHSNTVSLKKVFFDDSRQWLLALETGLPPTEFDAKKWNSLGVIQAFVTDMSHGSFVYVGEKQGVDRHG